MSLLFADNLCFSSFVCLSSHQYLQPCGNTESEVSAANLPSTGCWEPGCLWAKALLSWGSWLQADLGVFHQLTGLTFILSHSNCIYYLWEKISSKQPLCLSSPLTNVPTTTAPWVLALLLWILEFWTGPSSLCSFRTGFLWQALFRKRFPPSPTQSPQTSLTNMVSF